MVRSDQPQALPSHRLNPLVGKGQRCSPGGKGSIAPAPAPALASPLQPPRPWPRDHAASFLASCFLPPRSYVYGFRAEPPRFVHEVRFRPLLSQFVEGKGASTLLVNACASRPDANGDFLSCKTLSMQVAKPSWARISCAPRYERDTHGPAASLPCAQGRSQVALQRRQRRWSNSMRLRRVTWKNGAR